MPCACSWRDAFHVAPDAPFSSRTRSRIIRPWIFRRLPEPLTAALIGALATVAGALVQLRISWRREMKERERGQPITKKTRRGPVIVVFALLVAAAVGGFALSQYFVSLPEGDRDALPPRLHPKP